MAVNRALNHIRRLQNIASQGNEKDVADFFGGLTAALRWALGMQAFIPGAGDFDELLVKLDAEASQWPSAAPARGEKP